MNKKVKVSFESIFTSTQSFSCFSSRWEEKDTAGDSCPFDWNLIYILLDWVGRVNRRKTFSNWVFHIFVIFCHLTLCRGVELPLSSLTTAQSLDGQWWKKSWNQCNSRSTWTEGFQRCNLVGPHSRPNLSPPDPRPSLLLCRFAFPGWPYLLSAGWIAQGPKSRRLHG